MRLAVICGRYRPDRDGVADYVRRLRAELAAYGVDVQVVTAGPAADGAVSVARRWDLAGVAAAARALRGADVVHVQFAPSAYGYSPSIGLLPALLRGVPVVTTLHEYGWWAWPARVPAAGWRPLERRRWWDRETLTLAPRSATVVVGNEPHRRVVEQRFAGAVRPVVVPIGPNVADVGLDRAAARRRLGVDEAARLLVFFGFVHPVKGVRELIDALVRLRAAHRDLRLLVAGGVESLALPGAEAAAFERELRDRIAAAGVADLVRCTGWLPAYDASAALSAADLVVLPFTAGVTAKSGSLLAAWAHHRPVVATLPAPPDPEVVAGETVVPITRVRDADAIAAAVDCALGDEALRVRVVAGGAARAREHDWGRIAAAHAELYAQVAGREAAGA